MHVDDEQLRAASRRVLRRLGPLAPAPLAAELASELGLEPGRLPGPGELWSLLLDEPDPGSFAAFPLEDGRLCDLDQLLDGLVLTRRLTAAERREQRLDTTVDLAPVVLLVDAELELPLVDGGSARQEPGGLGGPDGWLPDAELIAVEVHDGRVRIVAVEDLGAADPRTGERLASTYQQLRGGPHVVGVIDLVLGLRARFPRELGTLQPPLGELLELAGLREVDDRILAADEPDPVPVDPTAWLVDHLREDHELDDEEIVDVLTVERTMLRLTNQLREELLDRLAEEPDRLPDPQELAQELVTWTDPELGDELGDEIVEAGAAVAALLHDLQLAVVLLEDLVEDDPLRMTILDELVRTVEPHLRERAARANAAWVRAQLVELVADDVSAAEPLLRRSLELDPDHVLAAVGLSGYLDDRGRAGAALSLLRDLEGPGIDGIRELLARYAQPGPTSAGRNQPCPCGSGRKHKVCCQPSGGWPLQERMDWIWHKLVRFLMSAAAQGQLRSVAEVAGFELEPPELLDEVALVNLALFEGELLAELCDRKGALLPADELELLRAWSQVRATAQEVVEVDPDARLTLLDLRAGTRTQVRDVSMSRTVSLGDALLLWLVPTPAGTVPASGGIQVPDHLRSDLLQLLDQDPSAELLASWYGSLHAPPALRTTDGDPLELITRRYRVPDPSAAWTALAEELEPDEPALVAFHEHDGQRWLTGSVTREDDTLVVTVSSARRAGWFHELVARLVPAAELVDEERVLAGVHDLPARFLGEGGDDRPGGALDLDALDVEDRLAIEEELDEMMRRHEDAWVDTPLPALGGSTPRAAALDPTRHDDLVRLLDRFDQHAASWEGPGRAMDADRLRELLGW